MLNIYLSLGLFIAVGSAWRYFTPNETTADALQKSIITLVLWVLLPLVVLFTVQRLPLNDAALRILLYVLATTLIALAVTWFWLGKTKLAAKTKGAFLLAAVFGNVLFLGLPLNKMMFADWTMRVAVEYMLVANVILLFTVGTIFAKHFTASGKSSLAKTATAVFKDYSVWFKEPVLVAAVIGLVFNLAGLNIPSWAEQIETMLFAALVPLLLIAVGLSLNWTKAWNGQLLDVLPVVVVQLALIPVLMWGMVALFGSAGVQTTKALLLNSMLPATLFGFLMCDRYKLDNSSYALAFSASSLLSLVTVPLWYNVLL